MKLHGQMDYKWSGYDDGGNYNYGVVAACFGFSVKYIVGAATLYKNVRQHRAEDSRKIDTITQGFCDAKRNMATFRDKCR